MKSAAGASRALGVDQSTVQRRLAKLVYALGPIDERTRIWSVLVAPDQRKTPRVAAFFDSVVDHVDTLRPILTG